MNYDGGDYDSWGAYSQSKAGASLQHVGEADKELSFLVSLLVLLAWVLVVRGTRRMPAPFVLPNPSLCIACDLLCRCPNTANVLHAVELSKRWGPEGVLAVSLHPGQSVPCDTFESSLFPFSWLRIPYHSWMCGL